MIMLLMLSALFILGTYFVWRSLLGTPITETGYPPHVEPDEPSWASEQALRVPYLDSVESRGLPVQRMPADPIDAIDPADPLGYTLREQYKLMGDNRGHIH